MERVHLQRHQVDSERFREVTDLYNADLAAYYAGEPPADVDRLEWAARQGRFAILYTSLFAPDSKAMWIAAQAIAQSRAGQYTAETASAKRVKVPFGKSMVEIDSTPLPNASPFDWAEAWHYANLTRDKVSLELLAAVPDELFAASRVHFDEYQNAWRHALVAYYRGEDPTPLVERALLLTEPAHLKVARADTGKRAQTEYKMLPPLYRRDAEAFNAALLNALTAHKKLYDKKSQREELPSFLQIASNGLCAMAHDAGIPIQVDSEYLLPALIQRKLGP